MSLYGATTTEVGWVLALYNTGGFVASLVIPALADRHRSYLRPMIGCGVLTLVLAAVLAASSSLPVATVALVLAGGPAGVGSSLLYAHLRHAGVAPGEVVNTRALVSVAWVGGPPLATLIIGLLGARAIPLAVGAVAVLAVASTSALAASDRRRAAALGAAAAPAVPDDEPATRRSRVALVIVAFVLLQAGNATVTSVLTLYVTQTLHAAVVWAGVALGLAAGLEVPALVLVGRLGPRVSARRLLVTSTLAGIAYDLGVAGAPGPVLLLALQPLNAWAFAGITGVGLPLFQQLIPRPGLATGLFMNARRVGAIASGPLIALGSLTALGERGIFVACAVLAGGALAILAAVLRVRPAS